ncbi:uncharacterized protein LOC122304693 [Carya illinoinensis]|uniref:uncharacterized protein LOC122304693 n=1 Tax=Carya illinoinensis TaxID=32201 RepID=UPI001C718897|nr:uncharacterized protein LOC122304693 [Carya illinoinensis]
MFELWSDWFLKLSREQLEVMAVVMRRIWLRRNGMVFDNKLVGPNEVFNQAVQCLTDFQLAQVKQTSKIDSSVPINNKAIHWKPPMGDILKVNWDAAWKTKEDRSGIGVVIRDSSGEVLASLCCPRTKVQDAMVAEIYALWRAMKLCAELNFRKVQFEGDALAVVNAVNSPEECWERHGQVVEDLKDVLRKRRGWSVMHVNRCCNNVAHSLAKVALSMQEERVWMEDYPSEILKCVKFDILCNSAIS